MSRVFSEELVSSVAKEMKVANLQNATIGDVLLVASRLEELTGIPFIRMDQGSPGLPANRIGIEAEKAALDKGLGAQYPAAAGVPELKEAASRFVKAFIDIDISPRACLPTTGSVAASFGAFIACTQRIPGKDKVLFIDPGFPIQKSQLRILGIQWEWFDIHDFRGAALHDKLESFLSRGDIAAIVYSNPNNPAWICLEEDELRIVGELATKYDAIVLDPPAFGRGPKNELWKLEKMLPELLEACSNILSKKPLFVLMTLYSIEASSIMAANMLAEYFGKRKGAAVEAGELALIPSQGEYPLPLSIWARADFS